MFGDLKNFSFFIDSLFNYNVREHTFYDFGLFLKKVFIYLFMTASGLH